jgi:M6 family metalloprotease-like protein
MADRRTLSATRFLIRDQANPRSGLIAFTAFLWLCFPSTVPAQTSGAAARIRDLADKLVQSDPSAVTTRTESTRLIQERADLIYRLIQEDPARAIASALAPASADRLRAAFPELSKDIEAQLNVESPAVIFIADDAVHSKSRLFARMQNRNEPLDVYFTGDSPTGAQCGATLRAHGLRIRDRMAATAAEVVSQAASSACSTTGDQKVAVLLVTFPGTTEMGPRPEAAHDIFFSSTQRSVDGYWRANSYGKASASGDVFGWYTLDRAYSCDEYDAMWQAAVTAAAEDVDFTAYNRFFLFFPPVENCGFTGLGTVGCSTWTSPTTGFSGSVAWEPWTALYTQDGGVSLSVHEGGHGLGLGHSRSLQFAGEALGPPGSSGTRIEYGDPYAAMAYSPGDYAAPHKALLGWLAPNSNYQVIETSGVYTIEPSETLPAGLKALKVRRGTSDEWLWLEYRQPLDSSDALLLGPSFSGAIVHYEDAGTGNFTDLLDFNPQTETLYDAPLSFWSDPYSDLTISVLSATPSGLTVSVEYGASSNCARVIPSVTLATNAISVAPGAAVDFSLTVRNNDPLTCQTARTFELASPEPDGWGSLFSVSTVSLAPQQETTITLTKLALAWASASPNQVAITATATAPENYGSATALIWVSGTQAPQPVSVTPSSGAGDFATFTFAVTDNAGYGDILSTAVLFNASLTSQNACYILYEPGGNDFRLGNDEGTDYSEPVALGSAGSAENSQCRVFGADSSAVASGKIGRAHV